MQARAEPAPLTLCFHHPGRGDFALVRFGPEDLTHDGCEIAECLRSVAVVG